MNFAAIDFEMPNNFSPKICAYGIALIEDGAITMTDASLVNPQTGFEDFIIDMTGISPEMVIGEPLFPEIWDRLREPLEKADIIIAHNAVCDLSILSKCLNYYGIRWKEKVKYICTCEMGTACYPELKKYSLKSLCDFLQIELDNHSADSDSVGCAKLLLNYLSKGMDPEKFIKEFDMVNGVSLKNGVAKKPKSLEQSVKNTLFTMSSNKHKEKACRRLNATDPDTVIGTPLNSVYYVAGQLRNKGQAGKYLELLPHSYHEENALHAAIISNIHNEKGAIEAVDRFLPFVLNCEICDMLCPSTFSVRKELLRERLESYLKAENRFAARFALNMLLRFFSDTDDFMDYFDEVLALPTGCTCTFSKQTDYFLLAAERHPAETLYRLTQAKDKLKLLRELAYKLKNNDELDSETKQKFVSLSQERK